MERRELLYGSGSVLAIAVAGCTGRAEDGDDNTTDEETADDSNDDETNDTEETADNGEDKEEADEEEDGDGSEADFDGDVGEISGFDAGEFSVGGDALTVNWMVCEEGVLIVNAVVDTSRTDLLEDVPISAEGLQMLSDVDPESISADDADSIPLESVESVPVEEIEPVLMEIIESASIDTVESIDDMERFSSDIREVRFTLCDETGTELLSFTIDVQWMLDVVNELMEDEEFVAQVRETVEYLVDDDELVARLFAAAEQTE